MVDSTDPTASAAKGGTVTRVLDILSAVAHAERAPNPTELAESLAIPKASVHRLCASLEQQGYLQSCLSGRGLLAGERLHTLALGVLSAAPYRMQRRAILARLSEQIGETCNIAVPDGLEMIYFDRAETHWPVRVNFQIGSRVPTYATAGGKMYLSTLEETHLDRLLHAMRFRRHTVNTLVEHSALKHELRLTAERGYALDNEEYIEGMVAMAVPVLGINGRLYATLSFHAPCMRVPFSAVSQFLPQLQSACNQLSEMLDE